MALETIATEQKHGNFAREQTYTTKIPYVNITPHGNNTITYQSMKFYTLQFNGETCK